MAFVAFLPPAVVRGVVCVDARDAAEVFEAACVRDVVVRVAPALPLAAALLTAALLTEVP